MAAGQNSSQGQERIQLLATTEHDAEFEREGMAIESSIPLAARLTHIALASNFMGSGGLGVYARRLAAALDRAPYVLQPVQEGGDQPSPPMPKGVDLVIRHGWNHSGINSFARGDLLHNILPDSARNVMVFGFVPTLLSESQVESINKHFSLILCDSRWTAGAARAVGMTPRIVALPPPLWTKETVPARRSAHPPFTFLHVSNGNSFIKGTDLVIEAFVNAFGDDPGARLVLKLSGSGADHLRSGRRTQALVQGTAARNVELDTRRIDQAAMRTLYRSADCYVHVSRSESLGMPPLEAAACGVPSILHLGGPGLEVAELVPHFVVAHNSRAFPARTYRENQAATSFEADTADLSKVMLEVATGKEPEVPAGHATGLTFEDAVWSTIDDFAAALPGAKGGQ